MNEHHWIVSTESATLLDFVASFATPSQLRWIACGFIRRHWAMLRFVRQQNAVRFAEQWAQGIANLEELPLMLELLQRDAADAPLFETYLFQAAVEVLNESALEAARRCRERLIQHAAQEEAYEIPPGLDESLATQQARVAESRGQCAVLREIIANPFRPLRLQRDWLRHQDGVAAQLLLLIRREHRFSDLPILADALEDAGCDQEQLLRHLREPNGHLAGCWALEALHGVV
ncbi:MAG: hypothetical protein SNJ75_03605 [Gemmataceae bacterium]